MWHYAEICSQGMKKNKNLQAPKLKTEFRTDKITSEKCYPTIPLSLSNNPMDTLHALLIIFFFLAFIALDFQKLCHPCP